MKFSENACNFFLHSNFKILFPSSFQDMTHYKTLIEAKNKQTEKLKERYNNYTIYSEYFMAVPFISQKSFIRVLIFVSLVTLCVLLIYLMSLIFLFFLIRCTVQLPHLSFGRPSWLLTDHREWQFYPTHWHAWLVQNFLQQSTLVSMGISRAQLRFISDFSISYEVQYYILW